MILLTTLGGSNLETTNPIILTASSGNSITLHNSQTITDNTSGQNALLLQPQSTAITPATYIDTIIPVINSVSSSGGGKAGDVFNIDITYNDTMLVSGSPYIQLNLGNADYNTGSGTNTLRFQYTIQNNDNGAISLATPNEITLNSGTITDKGGNVPANFNLTSYNSNVVGNADTIGPSVSGVVSNVTDAQNNGKTAIGGTYYMKETDKVTIDITYNENITASSPTIVLNTGNGNKTINATQTGSTISGTYTVVSGDDIASLSIISIGGTITDGAGNGAAAGVGSHNLSNIVVDTTVPSISTNNGVYSTTPTLGFWVNNDTIPIKVLFNENVVVTGSPKITLTLKDETNSNSIVDVSKDFYYDATLTNAESTDDIVVFKYNVEDFINTTDTSTNIALSTYQPVIDLNGGTITDRAGNAPSNLNGTTLVIHNGAPIDTRAVRVTSVTSNVYTVNGLSLSQKTAIGGDYYVKEGDWVKITVNLTRNVTFPYNSATAKSDLPYLNIKVGTGSVKAYYENQNNISTNGTTSLTFIIDNVENGYKITNGMVDTGGIEFPSNTPLNLNTNAVAFTDSTNNVLDNTADFNGTSVGETIIVDTTAPTINYTQTGFKFIDSAGANINNVRFKKGDTINFSIPTTENMVVNGTPSMKFSFYKIYNSSIDKGEFSCDYSGNLTAIRKLNQSQSGGLDNFIVFSGTIPNSLVNGSSDNNNDENYEIYFGDDANTELFTTAHQNMITDRAGNVLDLQNFFNTSPTGAGTKLKNANNNNGTLIIVDVTPPILYSYYDSSLYSQGYGALFREEFKDSSSQSVTAGAAAALVNSGNGYNTNQISLLNSIYTDFNRDINAGDHETNGGRIFINK